MKRLVLMLAAVLLGSCKAGDAFSGASAAETGTVTIYSTTDAAVFRPVIADFRSQYPKIDVRYVELEAAPLYNRFLKETAERRPVADLLLSSAADLQVKLVNDGYAARHVSSNALALPGWARWRDEAFGFTFEPAVMVFNRRLITGRTIPRSRPELVSALSQDAAFWRGRVGTYDIARSSVGYLIASQDSRHSSEFAALWTLFRQLDVKRFETTSDLLREIESGKLVMGYNLLGSYARARQAAGAPITIVYPEDFTLAVTRTAVLPKNAPHPGPAHLFLEYLLSIRGQRVLTSRSPLSAVRQEITGPYSRLGIAEATVGPLRPIALSPGLLVYLDRQKRQRLLNVWRGTSH
jgi:iron(III) transport system substrate-binding protein